MRQEQAFKFRFTDSDGVVGERLVVIAPLDDKPPKVKEFAPDDSVRKVKDGYMVAVGARIPFKGNVEDDHGLSEVRYAYLRHARVGHVEAARYRKADEAR